MCYEIVSIRNYPYYLEDMVNYYTSRWKLNKQIWFDLISDCISTNNPLPRWYLMKDNENIIGCVGLMTDDVTKLDFKPGIAELYVEENMRGKKLGAVLLEHAIKEAKSLGLSELFLSTYHKGYFEKYGWIYLKDEKSDSESRVRNYVYNI